ncbi:MAG: gliding motility-associated C-terminal domain-containing protein, partial [Chitinophagaceae bacterium]|nr:gliding motility-associated C-terminal domain-containing protein [Chitinophagaceae bacterium]
GAATYQWSPLVGLTNPTIANPIATPTASTEYFVTGTTVNGCIAKDSITISIKPKPAITISPDTLVCQNSPVQLTASGGTSYIWTPSTGLDNPTVSNPVASPSDSTTYYVTVTEASTSCSSIDSVDVFIRPEPVFTINAPASICETKSITLSASGGHSYSWHPDPTLSSTLIANPIATPLSSKVYTVDITDSICNTTASLSTTVTVWDLPTVQATSSNDIDCSLDFSQLTATGATTYEWLPATGLSSNRVSNPIARPVVETSYSVKGTDDNGCVNFDTVMVKVVTANLSGYLMPNAFSPNGDGLNECYGIKYWGVIQELEFGIYNRWGERIFFTKDPSACWNGKYRGTPQDIGVYVYMIKAKTLCGSTFKKGIFTLVR